MRVFQLISLLLILSGFGTLSAQKVKSKPVRFRLDSPSFESIMDTISPEIKIIKPGLYTDSEFQTDLEELDLVGEVSDQSKIRFVSVNREIMLANETGVFVSKLRLNAGVNTVSIKAGDDNNNIKELEYVIVYQPPVVTLADRINKESTYYGLLIGVDDYQDRTLDDLEHPIQDAENLKEVLTTHYTFASENVKVLKNPGRADIINELHQLREKVSESDNLLIFYAGHGYYDDEAEVGYWLPSDASLKTSADWFPNSTLVNHLKAIDSKHTLLITDACFAGAIFKSRSAKMTDEVIYERIYELPSRKAMTSGTLTEVPDESVFIKYLIQRLKENEETYLSSQDLFGSLRKAVISNSNVLPRYGEIQNVGNQGGDFIFLKRNQMIRY